MPNNTQVNTTKAGSGMAYDSLMGDGMQSQIAFSRDIGTAVYDCSGRCLGSIQNTIVNHDSGQVAYVVTVMGNTDRVVSETPDLTAYPPALIGNDKVQLIVERALEQLSEFRPRSAWRDIAARQIENLTVRQREIMDRVLAGHPSKNIAADLKISRRTVENHRAAIMKKTGAKSLPALTRLAIAAI